MIGRTGLFLLIACAAAGCAGSSSIGPTKPVMHVDAVFVEVASALLNVDDKPGPDGLEVRISFFQLSQPQPVAVAGTLEFLLFEGKVNSGELGGKKPSYVWKFEPYELPAYMIRPRGLLAYGMRLRWGKNIPQSSIVTLIARYQPKGEKPVFSQPVLISMRPT